MTQGKPTLKLIEDPVAATLWFLKRLPLDAVATYLTLLTAYTHERGLLSDEEQTRLAALTDEILSSSIYRAA